MPPAQYDSSTLTVTAGDYTLKAKGRILRFDGWTKVLPQIGKNPEDQELPSVTVSEKLALKKCNQLNILLNHLLVLLKRL